MHFYLFSGVKAVRGIQRALLMNLSNGEMQVIPHMLFDILDQLKAKTIIDVKKIYGCDADAGIDQYLLHLEAGNYGFFSDIALPDIVGEETWDFPAEISNIIIEISDQNIRDLNTRIDSLCDELRSFQCISAELRVFQGEPGLCPEEFYALVRILSRVTNCNIIVPYRLFSHLHLLFSDQDPHFFVANTFFVWDCPEKHTLPPSDNIVAMPGFQPGSKSCGVISAAYFSVHTDTFTESIGHNTCLNRKIAIDAEGNIRNCPSMTACYGNIRDTMLKEALNNPGFKELWFVHKDLISVCRDCEFRHVCTDCRAYIEDPEDLYSKPLKCGYNPYTCEWEEWSIHPLKQKAIRHYGMNDGALAHTSSNL